jgi:predicted dienelactone hydrolase
LRALALCLLLAMVVIRLGGPALAGPVGERHLSATNPTAALRDAEHRDTVRVTVWYPAAADAKVLSLDIGPPGKPLFLVGSAAPDAAFADNKRRPVILFSHGFGGAARMMAWFTLPLVRAGYVVIAVDHPGNNGMDKMTVGGAIMFWDRPGDLAAALEAARADPTVGPHLDLGRLGVAGFSAGGFTAIAATGAHVDTARLQAFCNANPTDGICMPQKEFPLSTEQMLAALKSPELAPEVAHSSDDHSIPGVRAAFAMAPAIVQAFDPASLKSDETPVAIILGDADPVAPPDTNGRVAARDLPHAELKALPGVGHYWPPARPQGSPPSRSAPTRSPKIPPTRRRSTWRWPSSPSTSAARNDGKHGKHGSASPPPVSSRKPRSGCPGPTSPTAQSRSRICAAARLVRDDKGGGCASVLGAERPLRQLGASGSVTSAVKIALTRSMNTSRSRPTSASPRIRRSTRKPM